ncbi:MAG: hypothetical protein IH587_12285 [Anaerolineae bacterium]|nr:hypothetical protein [Anaerolineae bacterium]
MSHYQRALRLMPENAGSHVIVSDRAFARVIMSIFYKSQGDDLRSQFRVAPTLDAAHAFILQQRQESGSSILQ